MLDDNENGKKALRLDRQNKNFFVNFFAVVARLRRETGSMDTYKKCHRVWHFVRRLNCRQIIRLNLKMERFEIWMDNPTHYLFLRQF